ncbi:glycosyltransferase family 4 protein [Cellulomonas aerilata]|uniref:glycosyltransferase family 4 protein n=1 Tax=Cellulomonas aerilata TaxID=515326 RepID=UPI0011BDC5F2|nr:glycosyltransferase family 4 protein [Cellulomonas aerilata]
MTFVLPGVALHPVGGYKVVYQYANHLVGAGHDVTVLHLRPDKPGDAGRHPLRRSALRAAYRLARSRRPTWFSLDRRIAVVNAATQSPRLVPGSDVIVATSVRTAHFVASVSSATSARGYYFLQHYEDFTAPAAVVDATWRLPLRKIAVAEWLAVRARELGVEAVVVPNAPDLGLFVRGEPIAARPHAVVAMVSDQVWKRTDLVADAMRTLAQASPGAQLLTFGTCTRPAVLPPEVRHVRTPTPAQLTALYQSARVFVCASDYEGFGLPVAEAMASGAAVVSTDNGGVRSFAGDTIVYAPVGDGRALAARTLELLADEDACTAKADAGHEKIMSYGLSEAASCFERCLADVA